MVGGFSARHKVQRVLVAFLVCGIIIGAPILSFIQIGRIFGVGNGRAAVKVPAMHSRSVDESAQPVRLFGQPLISITFDDGWESSYTTALPLLQKYGIHTTQYVLSGTEKDPLYLSWAQITSIQKAGHEIACHSDTHPDLTTLDGEDLRKQLLDCRQKLESRYGAITDFASPYGSADDRTRAAIMEYFSSQRNTNGDPTNGVTDVDVNLAKNFDPGNIIGVTVHNDTTIKQLQDLVSYAESHNGWLVVTYHQADDDTSNYSLDAKKLDAQLKYLSSTPVRIVTVTGALQSLQLQGVEY